jgi:DNA-binding response OmpR family regulator
VPKCVLIVEDETLLRRTLASALREAGYRAITADSAEEAEPHLFPQADVDLVVMDNRLPKATGISVLERLRENGAPCFVILMTAYDQAEVRQAARKWADVYVVKPFDLEIMLSEVARLLGSEVSGSPGQPDSAFRGPEGVAHLGPAPNGEGGDPEMAARRKKATRKKATRKKATRKKATRKKATRKKATRKKATRKKATRKKATRKKVAAKKK